jgi:hypothetical protein
MRYLTSQTKQTWTHFGPQMNLVGSSRFHNNQETLSSAAHERFVTWQPDLYSNGIFRLAIRGDKFIIVVGDYIKYYYCSGINREGRGYRGMEKVTQWGAEWSVFLVQYCAGGKIEKNEMACGAYGRGERCALGVGGKNGGKEATGESQT